MKRTLTIFFVLITLSVFGQNNLTKKAQPIVEEGKLLYRSEMASWYGTDLFLANYKELENVGGYFSYSENDISKCIFFSKGENAKVIGTISFDKTYVTKNAKIELNERGFTALEKDLHLIRELTMAEINSDTLFKLYENTNFNLIPLINGKERKVYVLTGPKTNGVILFGNDYLLTFDKKNKLTSKKALHQNLIPIYYGGEEENNKKVEGSIHNHSAETGDFITATDICTIMLYEEIAKWKTHSVVSEKYLSRWDCERDELVVISMDLIRKINESQEEENKK
jgi:hypothetical protein